MRVVRSMLLCVCISNVFNISTHAGLYHRILWIKFKLIVIGVNFAFCIKYLRYILQVTTDSL